MPTIEYIGIDDPLSGLGGGSFSSIGFAPPPSFQAPLTSDIITVRGTGSATFTRATLGTVDDFESIIRTALAGEPRFSGGRRIENLCPTPSTGIAIAGNKTITAAVGTYVFSMGAEATASCLITFTGTATGSSGTLTAHATKRTAKTLTITGAGTIIATCTVAAAVDIQFENVTGQSNQNPSEYVSVGVLSSPWHGAGVDGVKYFPYQNGNTVASNVVTEARGADIPGTTLKGGLVEGARQNRCLYGCDFTNAAWVSGGGGIAVGADSVVGPDGITRTTNTLTASGANGTLIQDLGVVGSAAKAGSIYLKRKTGAGNIDLTMDGSSTWTTVAVGAGWTRFEKDQTLADEDFGIRIVTSGDAVYACYAQVETGAQASYPVATTSAAVTRNADFLSYPTAGNIAAAAGTVSLSFTPTHAPSGTVYLWTSVVDGNNYSVIYHNGTSLVWFCVVGGVVVGTPLKALAFVAETTYRIAVTWGASGKDIFVDGIAGTHDADTSSIAFDSVMNVGGAYDQPFAAIKNVKTWLTQLTPQQVAGIAA